MTGGMGAAGAALRSCYDAAVAAVQPGPALRSALANSEPDGHPSWIIGTGKASYGMAAALVDWLSEHGRAPAGGTLIGPAAMEAPHPSLRMVVGDHPVPGAASARAAEAIRVAIDAIPLDAQVHVAISGGASALMAGPLPPLSAADLTRTFELLLTSGLDIHQMNAVRKRVTQWSAGRLGLALAPRALHVWVISDVLGDDLSSIASGPCTGDAWTSSAVQSMLIEHELASAFPPAVENALRRETPKPDDPWLRQIAPRIVASNSQAVAAAARAAEKFGVPVEIVSRSLQGDAMTAGRTIADTVRNAGAAPKVLIWGGETTVTIGAESRGIGGRSQELALAAAEVLRGSDAVLLAAGTDGRDGPTDAAGALVDGTSWDRMIGAGRRPADDLRSHDSHPALDAIGALVRTGATGTNVMDVVIAATGWG